MNNPFSQLSRADLEAKVTAMVLGELAPSEAAALQALLARDPELLNWQRRLERTLARVREAVATPGAPAGAAVEAPRLSDARRDSLIQQLRRGRTPSAASAASSTPSAAAAGEAPQVIPVRFEAESGMARDYGVGSLALAAGLVALLGGAAFLFTTDPLSGRDGTGPLASLDDAPRPVMITEALAEAEEGAAFGSDRRRFGLFEATDGRERVKVRGYAGTATNRLLGEARSEALDSYALVPPTARPVAPSRGKLSSAAPSEANSSPAATIHDWFYRTQSPEAFGGSAPVLGDTPQVGSAFRFARPSPSNGGATPPPPLPPASPANIAPREEREVLRRQLTAPAAAVSSEGRAIAAGVSVEAAPNAVVAKDKPIGLSLAAADAEAGSSAVSLGFGMGNTPQNAVPNLNLPSLMSRGGRESRGLESTSRLRSRAAIGGLDGGATEDVAGLIVGKPVATDDLMAGAGGAVRPPRASGPSGEQPARKELTDLVETAETKAPAAAGREMSLAKEKADELEIMEVGQADTFGRTPLAEQIAAPVAPSEVQTEQDAYSTFSLNVTDVSFKLAEASLSNGAVPDAGTIRSEEFLNAFDYHDPQPAAGAPLGFSWDRARDPFTHGRDLLRLAVKTAASGREEGRSLNLVLVVDNSGSMERADRVGILRECLRVLAGNLGSSDRISVVAFARTARLWVEALPGDRAGELLERVGQLTPEGGTNLEDALRAAYETALKHFVTGGGNRVILLTDGAANLGEVRSEVLRGMVVSHRSKGVALDCFGIGWEGYNDEVLEALSRNGDGRYGFVNSPEEASAGFAAQLAGALQVAASDVKVQVEFHPRRVGSWRQIGYAKHRLTQEQFRDNTVDAAEIGAAESGNALYVIDTLPNGTGPVATVRVRFREPSSGTYREHAWEVPYTGLALPLDQSRPAFRLAAVATLFAEALAESPYAAEVTSDRLLALLTGVPAAFAPDARPGRLEWMLRQAKSLKGR